VPAQTDEGTSIGIADDDPDLSTATGTQNRGRAHRAASFRASAARSVDRRFCRDETVAACFRSGRRLSTLRPACCDDG
jgi:hypothetical protein